MEGKINMFIYRIENQNGEGCYINEAGITNKLQHHNGDMENHPTPLYDKGILRYVKELEFCGFKSLTQLKHWFTLKQIKRMRKNGYTIHKIEVE
jgi:hypothetical protein